MNDLCFKDGVIDISKTIGTILQSANVYHQSILIKRALKPYVKLIEALTDNVCENVRRYVKCCEKYKLFMQKEFDNVALRYPLLDRHLLGYNVNTVFICKIETLKEIKLKEFNNKVLNNVLACNKNLHKWGKQQMTLVIYM